MTPIDYAVGALTLFMAGLLVTGTAGTASRASLPRATAVRLGVGTGAAIAGWLVFTAWLAAAGRLAKWDTVPPRVAFLPLSVLATMLVVSRTHTFGRLVEALPLAWPIALQTFRVVVELLLWGLFTQGRIPERMTFGGRNFDILVGLSAPLVAWGVATGRIRRVGAVVWNIAGLALLANIVVLALRSAPGPFNAGWGGVSNTAIAEAPFVWLPAFLVPLAVAGHVVSLRQALAARGRSGVEEHATTP
jgi:hypothetical protein